MGDGMTDTPWDVLIYFLVFGGVPAFAVFVPLIVVPYLFHLFRRIRHRELPSTPRLCRKSTQPL